ncbi:Uncharacterised protein [Bordetella pertussis]|nr:Uncharacterised protein [Bordetella pertussis]
MRAPVAPSSVVAAGSPWRAASSKASYASADSTSAHL